MLLAVACLVTYQLLTQRTTAGIMASSSADMDLIPQKETGAADFPYRGEHVILGVLDTGVDPGATHLPSLLNVFDCTGSGDVPLEDAVAVLEDADDDDDEKQVWKVKGLSGRTLSLPSSWNLRSFPDEKSAEDSKSVSVRLGIKAAYQFFPSALINRLKEERKQKLARELANDLADARSKLAKWYETFRDGKPSQSDILDRDNTQALIDVLTDESREDPGPIFDCVVFYDGQNYRAAIVDCVESNGRPTQSLAAFGVAKESQTVSTSDQLRFAVQFYDDYRLLSIVVDSSPHGSHVAGIAASVAPEVSIISFKIGEPRLGSMETGPSLRRAMLLAVKTKCDVINLSYGESAQVPDSGHLVDLARDVVWKYGITFVAAAGNQGPALSTVKALGGTTTACLGIAAGVSPAMRTSVHSIIRDDNDSSASSSSSSSYTWSSTGPAVNGYFGVDLLAPGAAIAGIPSWCLQKSKLMNGTSMASPHAAACIALLLSACKANGISTSPNRIRRALENTAVAQPHLSIPQQGWGLINVPEAWKYLETHKDDPAEDWHFHVSVTGGRRGIYLRQLEECIAERNFNVFIRPEFKVEDEATPESQTQKLDLELQLDLRSSVPWVQVPDKLVLMNNGRSFEVKVDPSKLEPGLHVARVFAVQSTGQVLFSVPITVTKPIQPVQTTVDLGTFELPLAEVCRHFIVPPPGSTWMDVTLQDTREANDATSRIIALHTMQIVPHSRFSDYEHTKRLSFLAGRTHVASIPVVEGVTVEMALARFWSTRGPTFVNTSITFRGVRPTPEVVSLVSGSVGVPVRVTSDLANEPINPKVKLTHWQCPLSPQANASITVLGERDTLGDQKKTYQLVLTYEFEQEEKGSITPRAPGIQGVLYESGLQSQCMMIFDGDKKYIGMSDAYPSTIDVPKGKAVLRLQLRHTSPKLLERYKDLTVWIERKLKSDIPLSIVSTRKDLGTDGGSFQKQILRKGTARTVFVAEPDASKLPDGRLGGHRLTGIANYAAGEPLMLGEGKKPGGYPVTYAIGSKPTKGAAVKVSTPEPSVKKTLEEKMNEAIRETKIGFLDGAAKEGSGAKDFNVLYDRLVEEYPSHLPLLAKKLRHVNETANMVSMADAIIGLISEDELALHFGRKINSEDGDALERREALEEKKSLLVEALFTKALALLKNDEVNKEMLKTTMDTLESWVDIRTSKKFSSLFIANEMYFGRLGLALARVNELLLSEEKGMLRPLTKQDLLGHRASLLNSLGLDVLTKLDLGKKILACPRQYANF